MINQIQLNVENRLIDWAFFENNRFCHAYQSDGVLLCGTVMHTRRLNPVPYSALKNDFDLIDLGYDPEITSKKSYMVHFFCLKCMKKAHENNLLPDFITDVLSKK